MPNRKDYSGEKYGQLTAIKRTGTNHRGQTLWLFKCDCGGEKIAVAAEVRRGGTRSCGCLGLEQRKQAAQSQCHAYSRAEWPNEYRSWENMIARCFDPSSQKFANYGGRGISVCEAWKASFESFAKDMGHAPEGYTLDRIDGEKGYFPDNCRWATAKTQGNNTRANKWFTYNGETKTIQQWCDLLSIDSNRVYNRIFRGWPVEDALFKPAYHRLKRH